MHLKDKVALVTGGSRGLGRGICLGLAAEGAKVAVNYTRNAEMAEQVVRELQKKDGVQAVAVQGDVANSAEVVRMVSAAEERLGPLDILVNNAGVCPISYIKDMPEEMWRTTIDINLTGTFLMSRDVVRRWLAAGRKGRIVNVVSPAAFNGSATGKSHYAASKAGVVMLTVSLAHEVAKAGIAVNAVAPGMMLTEMTAETLRRAGKKYEDRIPLGRIGEIEEIANVVAFLASERASYMTGATVDVSGGMLMR
ncbi:MAG: SDR family NAD(P)-dependent oxidoreductase [Thermoguttaceae bacterium]